MNGATIVLLFGCGVIVSATIPRYKSQNINTNENTNIFEDSPTSGDDSEKWNAIKDPDQPLDGIQLIDGDSPITSRALAAVEAAKEIMDKVSVECNERATAAVVEAVINILMNRDPRKNRRNYNVNTNTNTNILGGARDYERDQRDRQDLIYEKDPDRESLDDFVNLVNNKRTGLFDLDLNSPHQGYVIGSSQFGPYHIDPIDRQRIRTGSNKGSEDSKHPDDIILEKLLESLREDEKANSIIESPSNELLLQEQPWIIDSLLRKNKNSDRRNPYSAFDPYRTPILKSSPRYEQVNSNTNTNSNINNYRRNVNSNSNYNTNNFRRNINSNSNSNSNINTNNNRIGQRSPSRRY